MSRAARDSLPDVSVPSPQSPLQEFPTYRLAAFLPPFLLGWGLGAALTFLVRGAGGALLADPCRGHTLLALALPLLLGPGGLAFTAANWRRPRRAALGLGLVVASLLPALYVGARDIAALRGEGCAGGYIVFAPAGGGSVSSLGLAVGETRELTGRIGGYTTTTHPGLFTLQAQSSVPGVQVTLPERPVRIGQVFPVRVTIRPGTGVNTYTAGVQATSTGAEKPVTATSTLEITVRPARLP